MGENYFNFSALYADMIERFGDNSHFVELGGFKGKSTAYMAVEIINSGKNIKFDCVDLFVDCPQGTGEEIKAAFFTNIEPVKDIITITIKDSVEAAGCYRDASLEFVFIDADHTYEGVKRDIQAWLPKIKSGGILAGHDFRWEGVGRAVRELLPKITEYPGHPDCYWHLIN